MKVILKILGEISDVPCYFVSLDDLIKKKKAAGRGKDKEDLRSLEKIKEKLSSDR